MSNSPLCRFAIGLFALSTIASAELPNPRRPVAVQWHGESRVIVANRCGTVSYLDLNTSKVLYETRVGSKLTDMTGRLPNGCYAITDIDEHCVLLVRPAKSSIEVVQRIAVSEYPTDILSTKEGTLYVSCLWSRRLSVVQLAHASEAPAFVIKTIDMPFAPGKMAKFGQRELVVCDRFAGQLALLDTARNEIVRVKSFAAHNIRGMAINPASNMLVVAHQMLNELAHTVRNDVHWGLLMSNDLRWIPLANLTSSNELHKNSHMLPLGEANSATADPGEISFGTNGIFAVALSGVGEVAIGREGELSLRRVKVGRRPTSLEVHGDLAIVANTLGDSISVVNLLDAKCVKTISLGSTRLLTSAERGELVFFDASLSHDSWMSCQSCHTDGHTNGLMNDNFSDASFGAPKRVLSLLGKSKTAPFSWNGKSKDLESQIIKSVRQTMQGDRAPTEGEISDLADYLETLKRPPSIDVARGRRDQPKIRAGENLFKDRGCVSCHRKPNFTSPEVYDVGLRDKQGNTHFNPPSLIGVGQRSSYFHDSRATSLKEVFRKHKHQLDSDLSKQELDSLIAYLRSL